MRRVVRTSFCTRTRSEYLEIADLMVEGECSSRSFSSSHDSIVNSCNLMVDCHIQ